MSSITGTLAGASGMPPVPMYLAISKNEQALAQQWANSNPQVKADVAYFQAQAPKLTTVDSLMKDYRSLNIVLGAFNMSGEIAYPGLVKQLITQNPNSTSSTAYKIANPDYLRFATAMGQYNPPPFATAGNITAVTNAYVLNSYEASQGQQIPGMADALAFKRQASQITSVTALMSDQSLLKVAVAQTGLDWSTFGVMSYDQQVTLLSKNFKASDYQNATKVDQMAERYLVLAGQDPTSWGESSGSSQSVVSLLGGNTDPILGAIGGTSSGFSTTSNPTLSLFA